MTRSQLDYVRPSTPRDAIETKALHGDAGVFWAGGTDLVLNWQRGLVRPEWCIDLTGLAELASIRCTHDGIRIGALTTLATLESSGGRHPLLEALADVARLMCTPQTRSIATVGGNLCNASPAADLLPPLVAMDTTVELLDADGLSSMALSDFVTASGATVLGNAQMLTALNIPLRRQRQAAAYRRIDRTVVDIALVSAAVAMGVDETGICRDVGIALGAVGPTVPRCPEAEALLTGKSLAAIDEPLLDAAARAARRVARPIDDIRASADYRKAMVGVMTKRALESVLQELRRDPQ